MNVFPMDEGTKAQVASLALRAARPENWYRPFAGAPIPGDSPTGKLRVGSYTVVFTWSVSSDGKVHRHLSVRSPKKYATPEVVFTIAHWLGYTGATLDSDGLVHKVGEGWHVVLNPAERTVVVGQAVEAGSMEGI